MAYSRVKAAGPTITLYKASSADANFIRTDRAAWIMLGRPSAVDLLYESTLHRLAIRSGSDFAVVMVDRSTAYSIYAREVYDAAGIDLKKDTNYTPQPFTWGDHDVPDPDLAAAVWIQLA